MNNIEKSKEELLQELQDLQQENESLKSTHQKDIALSKQINSELLASIQKYQNVVNNIHESLIIEDVDGRLIFANDEFCKIFGFAHDEVNSLSIKDYTAHESYQEIIERHNNRINGVSVATDFVYKGLRKDGSKIWLEARVTPLFENNICIGTQTLERDITERRNADLALQESEALLQAIIHNNPECIKIVDKLGRLITMNPAGLDIIQSDSLEQVALCNVVDLIAPEYKQDFDNLHQRVLAGESVRMEFEVLGLKGKRRWLETNAVPMLYNDEFVQLAVTRDISERKLAEVILRKSEAKFAMIFNSCPEMMAITTLDDGKFIEVNDALLFQTGFQRNEVIGHTSTELNLWIDPDDRRLYINKLIEKGYIRNFECQFRMKNNVVRDFLISSEILELNGTMCGFHFYIDITEKNNADRTIRQLSQAVEQSTASIIITDTSGAILYVNPTFSKTTGYTSDEVLGKNPRFLKSGEMSEAEYKLLWDTIKAGDTWSGEFHNRKKSGELYWEQAAISPIVNNHGVITNFLAVKENITEKKFANDALKQHVAQLEDANSDLMRFKKASVGRELKMIELKHEINGLLTKLNTPEKYKIVD